MKEFNVTGVCVPEKHYIVDISEKLEQITAMVDKGNLSFEGVGDDGFQTDAAFVRMFVGKVAKELKRAEVAERVFRQWQETGHGSEGLTIAFERLIRCF